MNIKKILKYTATAVVGSLAVGLLVACSSSASKDSATKKKTIEVGTVGTTKPFSYSEASLLRLFKVLQQPNNWKSTMKNTVQIQQPSTTQMVQSSKSWLI